MRGIFVLCRSDHLASSSAHPQQPASGFERPVRVIDSIPVPESVAIGNDGKWYVSLFGEFDVKGDGAVHRIDPKRGARERYAAGLDDPCGLLFWSARCGRPTGKACTG